MTGLRRLNDSKHGSFHFIFLLRTIFVKTVQSFGYILLITLGTMCAFVWGGWLFLESKYYGMLEIYLCVELVCVLLVCFI